MLIPTGSANDVRPSAGCGSPSLTAIPVPGARPVIGTTAAVSLANVPTPLSFIALGWSRTDLGPLPLPASLAAFGMSGCNLLQSAEEAWHSTLSGTSSFTLAVPNWSGLAGLRVYLQAWAPAPGMNSGNAIVSNGIEWIIGCS
jgi:hypothetical protein